jgi:tetratricopeptide (TPR) repeat protein
LEFKIAQVYQQLDNNQQAFEHAEVGVGKGGLSKPQQTYMFIAYVAYELGKYDEAKAAVDKAIELLLPKPPDHQAAALQAAIEEAIKERDAKKVSEAPPTTADASAK